MDRNWYPHGRVDTGRGRIYSSMKSAIQMSVIIQKHALQLGLVFSIRMMNEFINTRVYTRFGRGQYTTRVTTSIKHISFKNFTCLAYLAKREN